MLTLPSNNHHQRARSLQEMLLCRPRPTRRDHRRLIEPARRLRFSRFKENSLTGFDCRKLIRLVKQYGVGKWAQIVEKLVGRAGKAVQRKMAQSFALSYQSLRITADEKLAVSKMTMSKQDVKKKSFIHKIFTSKEREENFHKEIGAQSEKLDSGKALV